MKWLNDWLLFTVENKELYFLKKCFDYDVNYIIYL